MSCNDITIFSTPGIILTAQPSGPQGVPSKRVISPIQTASFTFSTAYDFWVVDASAGDIVATIPLGVNNLGTLFQIVRIDAGFFINGHQVRIVPTGSDTINGDGEQDLQGQFDSCGVQNLSTVAGGTSWIIV